MGEWMLLELNVGKLSVKSCVFGEVVVISDHSLGNYTDILLKS
jgi:hypothetical protein